MESVRPATRLLKGASVAATPLAYRSYLICKRRIRRLLAREMLAIAIATLVHSQTPVFFERLMDRHDPLSKRLFV
jgi:hypothetical protein